MKNIDSFDNSKERETEHFIQLICIAISNSIISRTERELLYRMGGRLGFSVNSEYVPPDKPSIRFEHAYDLIKMTLADGSMDKNEMKLVNWYMAKAGFKESEIPRLILLLLKGIKEHKSREELLAIYMKDH
jgi:hypothetical protein